MATIDPPFRADHVGSLLRPPAIHEARAAFRSGRLDPEGLREVEDREIAAMIPKLADTGIRGITDGEFRREWFHLDFLRQLGGITTEGMIASTSDSERTVHQAPPRITVTGTLTHERPVQVADFEFVAARTPRGACRRSTSRRRRWSTSAAGAPAIDIDVLPRPRRVLRRSRQGATATRSPRSTRRGAATSSSTTPTWPTCATPGCAQGARRARRRPRRAAAHVRRADQRRARGPPGDLTVGIHLCRGNFRSTWFAEGGYEPVAEVLFSELDVDAYFLEYDDERSGDFAPLRFVPPDKTVVLGLITSKFPDARAGGRAHGTHRGGRAVRRHRSAVPEPAVRVRQHGARQRHDRGRAVGQAAPRRRDRGRRVAVRTTA